MVEETFSGKGAEKEEDWREHSEKREFYYSTNIVRVIKSRRWVGHVACVWERKGAYRVLVEKPEGNSILEKPRYRWEN